MNLLQNQVAIITGGTAGIGKAIAKKFVESGAHVVIFGRNQERGERTAKELSCEFYPVDVAKTEEVIAAVAKVLEKHGKVDVLVNNAGITDDRLMLKMTEEDWDNVMAVNAKSCYNASKAVIRSMLKAKKGKIINLSSVVGLTGNAGQCSYAASKAAVIGFTKALAKEVASRNICVNCIAPGFIETQMTDVLNEAQKESILLQIPLAKLGKPEDVANLALVLGSSLTDYVTGQVWVVDGGMVM